MHDTPEGSTNARLLQESYVADASLNQLAREGITSTDLGVSASLDTRPRSTRRRRPLAVSVAKVLLAAEPMRSFSAVPRVMQRLINKRELQGMDARVWAELDHRAQGRGRCTAGSLEVAKTLGVARSTVSLSFSRLVAAGLLHRIPQMYRDAQGRMRDGKALNVLVGGNRALARDRAKAAGEQKPRSSPVSDTPDTKTFREVPPGTSRTLRLPLEPEPEPDGPLLDRASAMAAMRETIRSTRPAFA